jgi:hypothetical protein
VGGSWAPYLAFSGSTYDFSFRTFVEVSGAPTQTAVVNNVAPRLADLAAASTAEARDTTLTGSIDDPGTLDRFTVEIDWDGDGRVDERHSDVAPGRFSYTHAYPDDNAADAYPINLWVADDDGGRTSAALSVTVVNLDPSAADDLVTVAEDSGTTVIDVLANDRDPAGALDPLRITDAGQGRNGRVAVAADGQSLSYTPDRDFFGTDSFSYTISDGDGGTATATATVDVTAVNDAPVSTVRLDSTSPRTNDLLTATATAFDIEGDPVSLTYVWRVDGVVRQTTITSALTDTFDLSIGGYGDKGQEVVVEVTPYDGAIEGLVAAHAATVINSAPLVAVSFNTSTPGKHDVLTATVTPLDPDGDPLVVTYVWRINGVVVQTITTSALTATLNLKAFKAKKNDRITLEVTPFDGSLDGPLVSATAVVQNGRH